MSFADIAHIYDRFNDLSVYEYWLDFTLNSADQQPTRALDLACGTGMLTQLLAPFVQEMIGLDIDSKMLEVGRKETQGQENLSFIQGDMTQLPDLNGKFDLITCYLDSICFLENMNKVSQAFTEAYEHLNEGGVYLFDAWTPNHLVNEFDNFQYFDYDDEATLLWSSFVDSHELTVEHDLIVFERESDGRYVQEKITLIERTYPLEVYIRLLTQAGFEIENIEVFVDYGDKIYDEQDDSHADRWFFRCYK